MTPDVDPIGAPVRRGRALLRGVAVVLAAVGAVTLTLVAGAVLIGTGLEVDAAAPRSAADAFAADLRALPGAASATAEPGLGDLGTTPVDLYADVRLASGCTMEDVRTDVARLRRTIARPRRWQLHPTVWCGERGLTVSPSAAVTARRLTLLDALAADPSLRAAGIVVHQRGDDPSPDLDDAAATVELRPSSGGPSGVARRWAERIARSIPGVRLTVTSAPPSADGYADARLPVPGLRSIGVLPGGRHADALLAAAAGLDRLAVPGYVLTDAGGLDGCMGIAVADPAALERVGRLLRGHRPPGCAVALRLRAR